MAYDPLGLENIAFMEFLRQARENALKNQPMTYMPSQANMPKESQMHRTPTTEMRKPPVRGAKRAGKVDGGPKPPSATTEQEKPVDKKTVAPDTTALFGGGGAPATDRPLNEVEATVPYRQLPTDGSIGFNEGAFQASLEAWAKEHGVSLEEAERLSRKRQKIEEGKRTATPEGSGVPELLQQLLGGGQPSPEQPRRANYLDPNTKPPVNPFDGPEVKPTAPMQGGPVDAIQQMLQQPPSAPQPVPDQSNPVAMLSNMLNQVQTQAAVQGQVMQDNIAALASTGVNITSPVGQKIANAVAQLDPATVSMISDMIAKSVGNSAEGEELWNDLLFVSGLA